MPCLGHRDARVPAAQFSHERPDDAPLLFQRVNVAQQHVHRECSYVHGIGACQDRTSQ
jgi:hypothetical protein